MYQSSEIIQVIIVGSTLFASVVLSFITFIISYARKHNRYLAEKKEMESRFNKELLLAQIEIQEQTLKNIAQEIHDNIGQTLSLVKLNLNAIGAKTDGQVKEKVSDSRELVGKAIHDLRHLSKSMNTDSILALGLIKMVEMELSMIGKAGVFQTKLVVSGDTARIDPKKELILFRIVQEAVNNIIKHSDAGLIEVDIAFETDRINIDIRDNGKGFDPAAGNIEGSGLRNMKSRAELIGGAFKVSSSSGGTTITVNAPVCEEC